ncbi:hypothetical protein N7925_03410 [Streptomyces sp. CA-278952]|uniref:hypothetical protein n=1 Tax=unclassified Streptomyces TaxID=2593676 RepID=UPI00236748C5|nr:hypothetical protein [Streptomyces sp. CA-278952]WDG27447.1 hypothetical protein N7925_03410 [Streptomyces sp. CA-278952]
MAETWIALAVAVVGVAGTLGAAQLTQSRADRTKRLELQTLTQQQREDRDHAERVRQVEAEEAQRRELTTQRRACYITLNTASRQYQTAEINYMYALRTGIDTQTCLEQMEARRTAHRDSYAEAQMIVPSAVLAAASAASRQLNRGYGTLKQIAASRPLDEAALDEFAAEVETVWILLSQMRHAMRQDLGVDDEM